MVRTITQRKSDEADRRAAAVEALSDDLRRHARAQGGRYLLYGSAARRALRFDSDVDLLLDFPPDAEAKAWRLAEDVCATRGMPADIRPLAWCSPEFATAIEADAVVLGYCRRRLPTG